MAIQSGTHLGPYEIVSAIGAGGMGEVYRARDPKLGRDVAIKVLPKAFAGDAARMARFQREAKVLASLDHPNIATIHGLEESGGTCALVYHHQVYSGRGAGIVTKSSRVALPDRQEAEGLPTLAN